MLAEAAQYMSEGRHVVLVIEDVEPGTSCETVASRRVLTQPQGSKIGNDIITPAEARDLNRARVYLATTAEMHSTPVYDNISEAIQASSEWSMVVHRRVLDRNSPCTTLTFSCSSCSQHIVNYFASRATSTDRVPALRRHESKHKRAVSSIGDFKHLHARGDSRSWAAAGVRRVA